MELNLETILMALGLTLVAGMSTGIGALMALITRKENKKILAGALGVSAGVMIYVSFMELMPEGLEGITQVYPGRIGTIYSILAFFAGIAIIALIDFLIPEDENPHEVHSIDEIGGATSVSHLKRTGLMLAVAIAVHNFPEGIATFISALNGIDVALPIVIAIAIHNIPEGIAVSVPIYHATGDRKKALMWSLTSGFAEPLGAVFGIMFLLPFWTPMLSSVLLCIVSGIMVYISLDELLPSAEAHGYHHITIGGVIAGMAFMAFSLLLF